MLTNNATTCSITLPTASAAALFEHELKGQFSDGMWENARPRDHWRFWNVLVVKVAPGRCLVETNQAYACTKTSYDIAALYDIIGDRMLKIGRLARACELTKTRFPGRPTAEAMPETLEGYEAALQAQLTAPTREVASLG